MKNLVLTAIGNDRTGIVEDISSIISDFKLNIIDSKMIALGNQFTMIIEIEGEKDSITSFIDSIAKIEKDISIKINYSISTLKNESDKITYEVDVITMDEIGIVKKLSKHFKSQNANIEEFQSYVKSSAHTGTPMFYLDMIVTIDPENRMSSVREAFYEFCDEQQIEGNIEVAR